MTVRLTLAFVLAGCAEQTAPPPAAPATLAPPTAPVAPASLAPMIGAPDFSVVFARISPSVVGIVSGRRRDGRFQAERTGTGLVWDARAHIVTNDHLIADAEEVRVRSADGRVYRARLVGNDGPTDLAVLAVDAPLTPAERGTTDRLLPGQWVAAIGNPYGMDRSITVGVVSALGRQNLPPGGPRYRDFIQADLNVNPGNSGGPLVDGRGRVIGLTTAMIGGAQGLAFASPIERVATVVERLQADGRFIRGFAGLFLKPVSWSAASKAGLEAPTGARVRGVVKGGPAAKAGLLPGDIVLTYQGDAVEDDGELPWLIAATAPGTATTLEVARAAERITVTMTLTEAR